MNNICSAPACPIILDSTCVFYSGANLVYTGVNTNDNLQLVLEKIDNKFRDAGLGYVFTNGLIQTAPGQPVKLGGLLVENTSINSQGFTFGLSGTVQASAFITTGGTSSQFVKGDGSLDNGPYQPAANYITALTGDGTASGPGSSVFTLATVFNAPATYGSATRVPIITVNAKGLVTNVTTTLITVPSSSVSINGDVYGFGNTGVPFNLTLATVLSTPGVYGSTTSIPIINVNSKGLITSISQVTIGGISTPNLQQVTDQGFSTTNSIESYNTSGRIVLDNSGIYSATPGIQIFDTINNVSASFNTNVITLQDFGNPLLTASYYTNEISIGNNSGNFVLTYPSQSGTFALISDLSSYVTAVTATSPLFSSGGTTPNITIQQASGSQDGYLSSTDWTTFNGKQNPITLTTTGSGAATFIANVLNIPTPPTATFTSLTTTGSSGASTLIAGVLNVPTYTLAGLGGITLTSLSSTATGLTYTNTTGVFSLTSGYLIPTTASYNNTNWDSAYTNRITSLTTIGTSGAATLIANTLNIPQYQAAGTYVTSVTGTSPIVSSGGTTPAISIPLGTSSVDGYLSATDRTNFQTAYTNRITSLTTTGSGAATLVANVLNIPTPPTATFSSLTVTGNSGASTLLSGVLNVPTYTLSGLGGQPLATNLTSLSALTYASTAFVKMTAAGTFALDTNSYLTSITSSDVTTALGYTPVTNARTLTINGTTQDLTANRTWSVGDVVGPSSATDNAIVRFDTTTGKLIQNSGATLDDDNNITANSLITGFLNTAASGTTIVLTKASVPDYVITGSGGQTIKLPDATTLADGTIFSFNNNQSSGAITLNNNSNTLVASIPSGGFTQITLLTNSTAAGTWERHEQAPSNVSWSTNTFDYPGSITSATWNGNVVAINRGGTGSSTQNFVDLTANQTIAGTKTFSSAIKIPNSGSQLILAVNADQTVTGLPTTTYPSPAELSYVKGVTSSIQTQIDGKQATITGAATTITSADLTASRALISDVSGKVAISATTDTELGYVSGVTSGIQSQLNGKQATLTNPVTGTGTSTRVAFWNTASSLSSSTDLFWDNTNSRLGIGTATPSTTLDVTGKATINYSATTDFPLVIKNTNASAVTSNVLSFDCSATGVDQPVFVNLASTNPKGMSFFASNQAITATPVAAGFQIFSTSSTNFPGQMYFDSGANNNAALIFRTAITSGSITQRLRIFSNGNVSVSSSATDPGFLFNVNGTGRFVSQLTTAGQLTALSNKTTAYTLTQTDQVITADSTSAAFQVTLPTAVSKTGQTYTIKRTNAGVNNVTVGTTSSQTIDGSTTYVLLAQYKYVTVVSNGSNWFIISNN